MTPSTGNTSDRYVVISSDAHDGPPAHLEKYVDYFEAGHRAEFEQWLAARPSAGPGAPGSYQSDDPDPYRREIMDLWVGRLGMDEEWSKESLKRHWSSEPVGMLDSVSRMAAVETQGIAAEVLVTFGIQVGESGAAFGAGQPELRRAAAEAHMRWLADYCGAVPGRLAAPVRIDGTDLDRAIADIRWARELGLFGGVFVPTPPINIDMMRMRATPDPNISGYPPLVDPYWEPLWSVCEDLDLPLVIHTGQLPAPDPATYGSNPVTATALGRMEGAFFSRRPFWQLIASGAFDRHPKLKFCFIEIPVAALPGMLYEMDQGVQVYPSAYSPKAFKLLPSEYWAKHGFAAASLLNKYEGTLRHQIGVDNLMFGADYPHFEGSWPYTLQVQQHTLGGAPEAELRKILGGNAARCFGFDLAKLQAIADRVGPTVADLASPLPENEIPEYAPTFSFSPMPKGVTAGV